MGCFYTFTSFKIFILISILYDIQIKSQKYVIIIQIKGNYNDYQDVLQYYTTKEYFKTLYIVLALIPLVF